MRKLAEVTIYRISVEANGIATISQVSSHLSQPQISRVIMKLGREVLLMALIGVPAGYVNICSHGEVKTS